MSDDDKTIQADNTVPSMSSGTHEQGGDLLTSGMMVPPQVPGILGTIGKYQVVRVLGEGGMGRVLLARDPVTDSFVAIKIIKPEYLKKDWAVHRFLNEARHMFKLAHPSIIRVLEVSDRDEGPYFVMPFIAGGSLAQKIKPGASLPAEEILCVARQVADALQYAHARGIIHRDLKPSNILLDADGRASLCDFGLLRTVFNDSIVDVSRPQVEGTVPYMSPAVAAGRAEDTRCDIYGFGCLLYEMLTGQPPYQGPSVDAILKQIVAGPPRPIRQANPNAPAPLAAIAEAAMARELRDRYAAMADVIADLDRVARRKAPIGPHGRGHYLHPKAKLAAAAGAFALLAFTGAVALRSMAQRSPVASPSAGGAMPSATAQGLPVLPGLAAWWPGNGNAEDVIGHRKGVPFNGADFAPGFAGEAFRVNGAQYFRVPHDPALSFTNGEPLTLEAWVYRTGDGLPFHVMGKRPDPGAGMSAYQMGYDSWTVEVPTNRWTHLVVACSNDVVSEYLDGTLRLMERRGRAPFGPNEADILIGAANAECMGFAGLIQHVRIYDRILSPDDIRLLHDAGRSLVRASAAAHGIHAPTSAQPQVPFTYTTNDGAITITKYTGSEQDVAIPSAIGSLPVTSLTWDAFQNNTNVTTIRISQNVTQMTGSTLGSCSRLTTIIVDALNPEYCTGDDGVVFDKNRTKLVRFPTARCGKYAVPSSVKVIGEGAFSGAKGLTQVILPETVSIIEGWAFTDCEQLNRLVIPSGITNISGSAFERCVQLERIPVESGNEVYSSDPDGVVFDKNKKTLVRYPPGRIGGYVIPSGVTRIGTAAFICCPALTKLTVPDGVVSMETWAFGGNTNLAEVSIPKSATNIGHSLFRGCSRLTSVELPEGVEEIGYSTFCECGGLTNVTLPNGVTTIGNQSFWGCGSLKSLIVPASVKTIEANAFVYCSGLTGIYFKGDAPRGGADSSIFGGANNATVYYLSGTAGWGKTFGGRPTATWEPFEGPFVYAVNNGEVTITKYTGPGGEVVIPDKIDGMPVVSIGDNAFRGRPVTSVTIPNSVTSIRSWAFAYTPLSRFAFPESVTSIEWGMFAHCTALISVTIPNSITSIGGCAFYNCFRLTNITIPDSVISIDHQAFAACSGLSKLVIPKSVTSVGTDWFGLNARIVVDQANPAFCSEDGVLFNKEKTSLVHCPASQIGSYAIPGGVQRIVDCAFNGCTNLTNVTIPNSLIEIGQFAFGGCSGLTNVVIPESVTSIAERAFTGCRRLNALTVGVANPAYSSSDDGVLFNQSKTCLVTYPIGKPGSVEVPGSVIKIGPMAFAECTYLTSVTIPESVIDLGREAFRNCENLTAVYFEGDAPRLGRDVFEDSPKARIYYQAGRKGWGGEFGGRPTSLSGNPPATLSGGAETPARSGSPVRVLPARRYYPPRTASDGDAAATQGVATAPRLPFAYKTDDGSITITKYTGSGGEVVIPEKIDGMPVTRIGESAFVDCTNLARVTIPEGIAEIRGSAFSRCTPLANITIPASVTAIDGSSFIGCGALTSISVDDRNNVYSAMDGVVFSKDMTRLIRYPAGRDGDYRVPAGVIRIEGCALRGSPRLSKVVIPASVTHIEGNALSNCDRLTAIVVDEANPVYSSDAEGVLFDKGKGRLVKCPSGRTGSYSVPSHVTAIGGCAFEGSVWLTDITIPEGVTSIDPWAFADCARLASVGIPEGVTSIGYATFQDSTNLASVVIPTSVSAIGDWAFYACRNLSGVYFKGNVPILGKGTFGAADKATVYYLPGTTGWGKDFGGRPTAAWDPAKVRAPIPLPSKRLLDRGAVGEAATE